MTESEQEHNTTIKQRFVSSHQTIKRWIRIAEKLSRWRSQSVQLTESLGFKFKIFLRYFQKITNCHVLFINLLKCQNKTCWYTRSGQRINRYHVHIITIMCWQCGSSSTYCMSWSYLDKWMPLYNKPVNSGCWSWTVQTWLLNVE